MGFLSRFGFLFALTIVFGLSNADPADEPSDFALDDALTMLEKLLKVAGDALNVLKKLVDNVKEIVSKIKNNTEGDALLEKLREESIKAGSAAQMAPLYEDRTGSCDVAVGLEPIQGCLTCQDGKWTVHSTNYGTCSGNSAQNAKPNSLLLLLLPLAMVAFIR